MVEKKIGMPIAILITGTVCSIAAFIDFIVALRNNTIPDEFTYFFIGLVVQVISTAICSAYLFFMRKETLEEKLARSGPYTQAY